MRMFTLLQKALFPIFSPPEQKSALSRRKLKSKAFREFDNRKLRKRKKVPLFHVILMNLCVLVCSWTIM